MDSVFPRFIHCIGIKGSGLAAFAVLLKQSHHHVSGSDKSDVFYTDAVLQNAGITWNTGFYPQNIPKETELVIYSAAYTQENNEELAYAQKNAIPCLSYPEALGMFSCNKPSWAVIGTHGKTTTTGFIGILCKSQNISASVLTGSSLPDFENNAVLYKGDDVFFAEVCEYKNHFTHFSPKAAVFTSAEWDHPDYFRSADDVYQHFASFLNKLPQNAPLIACADDEGVQKVLHQARLKLASQQMYLYTRASSHISKTLQNFDAHIIRIHEQDFTTYEGKKVQSFTIEGLNSDANANIWYLPMPSVVLIYNATAAIISVVTYMKNRGLTINWHAMQKALAQCKGISRRSEVLYHDACYTIMDDYAHHPTAIKKTLAGIVAFYQPKRLRVNFMPHTHTRTEKLWNNFLCCFTDADEVIINDVYASAREGNIRESTEETKNNNTSHTAKNLAHAIAAKNSKLHIQYISTVEQTIPYIRSSLQCGDLFLSMGAGDNFRISHAIAQEINHKHKISIAHSPLCIAISGKSGCGNTSISSMLAKKLSIMLINYTFRSVAKEKNMSFEDVCKKAKNDPWWDKYVDEKQRALSKEQSCVVGSRLAIWFLEHANIKIYLHADDRVRAHNIQQREGGSFEQSLKETTKRDLSDAERYKNLYNIDISDYKKACDVIVETQNKDKNTIVEEILQHLLQRGLIKILKNTSPCKCSR